MSLSFKNLKFFSIDIHFGYGTLQETEKGAFVLNGCVINPQTPNFHCENCNIQFGRRKRFLRSYSNHWNMKQETYKISFNIYLPAKRIKLQSSELKPLFWPLKLNWRYFSVTDNSTKSRVDCNLPILVAKEKGWKNLGKTGIFWALSSCRTWVLKWRPNKKFAFEKVKALSGLSPWAKFTNGNRSSEQGESRALKANVTTCWEKAKSTFATCERSELRFQYF